MSPETPTIHGARYTSDATQGARYQRASSTNKVEPSRRAMGCHNVVEYARLQDSVSEDSSIYDPDEMEISSVVDAGNSNPGFAKEDSKKWCFCQDVAYGGMIARNNPVCLTNGFISNV